MSDKTMPAPHYSIWQSIAASLSLATRAIQEVRALAREPGPAGPPGADSMVPGPPGPEPYVGEVCGLFDPAREYRKYDLVMLGGSEWRARHDAPGALPGPGWALSASAGKAGQKGEQGQRGPAGSAATIAGWTVHDFHAIPVMSDGKEGAALDLRPLFEQYHAEAAK